MITSKEFINTKFKDWLCSWNKHNLKEVMDLFHENIEFENWTGEIIVGKTKLNKAWTPWFLNHGNFKFIEEDLFIDEIEQKMCFSWRLEWPSLLKEYRGKNEVRRGVDILHFRDGKIIKKLTYSKTTIHIEGIQKSLERNTL